MRDSIKLLKQNIYLVCSKASFLLWLRRLAFFGT